jgi:hypothetical protein
MGAKRGPIAQRQLLLVLRLLIDASKADRSGKARERLHRVLQTCHWRTPYILHNIGVKRCQMIASLGYSVPVEYLIPESVPDRLR